MDAGGTKRGSDGQALTEYLIIVCLMVLVLTGVFKALPDTLRTYQETLIAQIGLPFP